MVPSVSTKIITVKKYTLAIEAPMVRNIKYHPNSEYHIVNMAKMEKKMKTRKIVSIQYVKLVCSGSVINASNV